MTSVCIRNLRCLFTRRQGRPLSERQVLSHGAATTGSVHPTGGSLEKDHGSATTCLWAQSAHVYFHVMDVRHVALRLWTLRERTVALPEKPFVLDITSGPGSSGPAWEFLDVDSEAPNPLPNRLNTSRDFQNATGTFLHRSAAPGASPGLAKCHSVPMLTCPARDIVNTISGAQASGTGPNIYEPQPVQKLPGPVRSFNSSEGLGIRLVGVQSHRALRCIGSASMVIACGLSCRNSFVQSHCPAQRFQIDIRLGIEHRTWAPSDIVCIN